MSHQIAATEASDARIEIYMIQDDRPSMAALVRERRASESRMARHFRFTP